MGSSRAILVLLLLGAAALALPDAALAACDAFSQRVDLGGTRVYHLSSRCEYDDGVEEHAQREERFDVLRVEPSHPNGAVPVASLVVLSQETRYADGSSVLRHDITLYTEHDVEASAGYRGDTYTSGFTACSLGARATAGPHDAAYSAGRLPVCWPPGFLLP